MRRINCKTVRKFVDIKDPPTFAVKDVKLQAMLNMTVIVDIVKVIAKSSKDEELDDAEIF